MPHVIIKMYPGRDEETKKRLAESVASEVAVHTGCADTSISIAIEEIPQEEWPETVYRPDILEKEEDLYKKPGYNPFS